MKYLSLFSGAGGLDIGLEQAGLEPVALCENDPVAVSLLKKRWPDLLIHDDVTTLDGRMYDGAIDVVVGGSPCQDLSSAGIRQGLDGGRSSLFWHQCRIFNQSRAEWIIWENVIGALHSNKGHDFAAVLWGLTGTLPDVPDRGWSNSGIIVGERVAIWRVLDAQHFGVPQRRKRIFLIAGSREKCVPEILFDDESLSVNYEPQRKMGYRASPADGGSSDRSSRRSRDNCRVLEEPMSVFEDFRGGIRLNSIAPTVLIGGSKPGSGYSAAIIPEVNRDNKYSLRKLTPLECERLMGWEDDYTATDYAGDVILDAKRYKLCGNGVVSPVAKWIGERLLLHS